MSTANVEFYDLLKTITNEQTFSLELSPRPEPTVVSCKQLTTLHLKELIKTVVDSPLTQSSFNSTATKVFKQSLTSPLPSALNVIDRLLFILETRCQSLSPTKTITEDGETFVVDFKEISTNLLARLKENVSLLAPGTATEGKITVNFGVTTLDAELQLNEEIYKNVNPNVDDTDELRKVLGDAFINEIAKALHSITIQDKTLDLSTISFKSRLKAIEQLPASLIQQVIKYIENYKKIVDECLTVNNHTIDIDGSLFSFR